MAPLHDKWVRFELGVLRKPSSEYSDLKSKDADNAAILKNIANPTRCIGRPDARRGRSETNAEAGTERRPCRSSAPSIRTANAASRVRDVFENCGIIRVLAFEVGIFR